VVLGSVVGGDAGLLLRTLARVVRWQCFAFALGRGIGARSVCSGQGRCRVAAAYVSSGCMLANFFITISHCPWRDFISMSV
jgi:hypothetical protein